MASNSTSETRRYARPSVCTSASFVTEDGFRLGNWLNAQKRRYYAGKLEADRMKCLLQIGADWIDLQTIIPAPDARMHPLPRKNQAERKNKAV